MKELINIQTELNAPKSQYNKFGGYAYRSCEDILAAAKPLLQKYNCYLLLSDDIKEIGSQYEYHADDKDKDKIHKMDYIGTRVYVEATATIVNSNGEQVSVKAYAREEVAKKGMDAAQVTGSASSYARKYALNGLFAIDDTKDPDATNTHDKEVKRAPRASAAPAQAAPAAPKNEYEQMFDKCCQNNPTQDGFRNAFMALKKQNPIFGSAEWAQRANQHYVSLKKDN